VAAAETCESRLRAYLAGSGEASTTFSRRIVFAVALLREAATQGSLSHDDLRLIRDTAADAAGSCRDGGLDEDMLAAAAALQRVADACDHALGNRTA
jgi:hypothetical protein